MIRNRFAAERIDVIGITVMSCVLVCGRSEGTSVRARPDPAH
ncbi:MAG: hypothetical protein AB1774_10730 [Bacillota bacterium]